VRSSVTQFFFKWVSKMKNCNTNLGSTTKKCGIVVTKNTKNLAYDRTGNTTPHLYIVNYIPTTKLKLSVHISQKYGDLKCLKTTDFTLS
jgi:hypothetical protein